MVILKDLPPEELAVVWNLFSLKSEEEIAENMGISLEEFHEIRVSAEQTIGGQLPF